MKPSIGRVVIFRQGANEEPHNGSREHPAIVNHVWGEGETPALNLTVFPDCAAPESRTSVTHASKTEGPFSAWDWPPRVE